MKGFCWFSFRYPFYDQNSWKTLPSGAANTYIAHIREYPHPGFKLYNVEIPIVNIFRFKHDLHSPASGMRDAFKIKAEWKTVNRDSSLNSPLGAKSSSRSPKYTSIATGHKINLFRFIPCCIQCLIPPQQGNVIRVNCLAWCAMDTRVVNQTKSNQVLPSSFE